MAAPAYSIRLLRFTGVLTPVYTVGVGFVVVLRQATWVVDGSQAICQAGFDNPAGEAFIYLVSSAGTTSYAQWQGRIVLVAGESFSMRCSSPAAMVASGYRLSA